MDDIDYIINLLLPEDNCFMRFLEDDRNDVEKPRSLVRMYRNQTKILYTVSAGPMAFERRNKK